jgi:hypothetical protein
MRGIDRVQRIPARCDGRARGRVPGRPTALHGTQCRTLLSRRGGHRVATSRAGGLRVAHDRDTGHGAPAARESPRVPAVCLLAGPRPTPRTRSRPRDATRLEVGDGTPRKPRSQSNRGSGAVDGAIQRRTSTLARRPVGAGFSPTRRCVEARSLAYSPTANTASRCLIA